MSAKQDLDVVSFGGVTSNHGFLKCDWLLINSRERLQNKTVTCLINLMITLWREWRINAGTKDGFNIVVAWEVNIVFP